MVGYLGLKSEVTDKVSGKNIILTVCTDEPGRLIGRNGSALDSVGLLMNRILKKDDIEFPKVIIDVDGYDKKSRRDKRKPRRERSEKPRRQDKTVVMDEAATAPAPAPAVIAAPAPAPVVDDEAINRYIDEDSNNIKPVTTVPISDRRSDGRRNDGRRNDRRRNNRNDNRGERSDNRGERNDNRGERSDNRGERSDNRGERNDNRKNDRRNERTEKPAVNKPEAAKAETAKPVASAPQEVKAAVQGDVAVKTESKKLENKPAKSSMNRIQMQCRNSAKEVKRWGESTMLPPMSEDDCKQVMEYFKNDKELKAGIDDNRSYGDKKRVRVTLK